MSLSSAYLRQAMNAHLPIFPTFYEPREEGWHLKFDGEWLMTSRTVPFAVEKWDGYTIPVYEPDYERVWYDFDLRKRWHRPRWLLAHGVAL